VDIDSLELNGRVRSEVEIQSTITEFLEDLRLEINPRNFSVFINTILQHKEKFPQNMEQYDELSMNPNEMMEVISRIHSLAWGFIVDVGQHQMWAAQSITLHPGQRFITSGGLGSMGFALPASTGISLIAKRRGIVILGDGCAQLSAPEFQTIADLNLPLTIYVINNAQHGMVAQFQEEYLEARFTGTRIGYTVPNFVSLAKAYGIANCREITSIEQFESLEIDDSDIDSGPMLIEVKISNNAKALPKLSFGR
jgi:acetolactate synthase-1/2/3 large subunit